MKRAAIGAAVLIITIGVLAVCAAALIHKSPSKQLSASAGTTGTEAGASKSGCKGTETKPAKRYLGFASSSSVTVTLDNFSKVTGFKPTITQLYIGFGAQFPTQAVCEIIDDGALPVVQINPRTVSMQDIARGKYTSYLKTFGEAIRAIGQPVAIGFAHEPDGSWYDWGCSHTAPAIFRAAWQAVYRGVNKAHPHNVKWVWTVSSRYQSANCTLTSLWPGSRYVTWIGVDGYLRHESDTFSSVFGPILNYFNANFRKPVLITEAGVNNTAFQNVQMGALLRDAYRYPGILGLIYFDSLTNISNYEPQQSAADLASFNRAAALYFKPQS